MIIICVSKKAEQGWCSVNTDYVKFSIFADFVDHFYRFFSNLFTTFPDFMKIRLGKVIKI